MILRGGKVVPTTDRRRSIKPQTIEVRDGITGTTCAQCGEFTRLYHEMMMVVGEGQKDVTSGGWSPDYKWVEVTGIRSFPIMRRFWVCENHYSSRYGKIIPGKSRFDKNQTGLPEIHLKLEVGEYERIKRDSAGNRRVSPFPKRYIGRSGDMVGASITPPVTDKK